MLQTLYELNPMTIPHLKENQFAVGKAEYATGHVLTNIGTLFLDSQDINDMYEIFDSYEEARDFAIQKVAMFPKIECWIVNSKGEHILTWDKDGQRNTSK